MDVLDGRDLGDLPNAMGIQNVLCVEELERSLFEVVDGDVVEHEAVQIASDDLFDLIAEDLALLVEVFEFELLTDRLERLGEFGSEERFDRPRIGRSRGADGLRDLQDVFDCLIDPHEERHLDVCADIVCADEAFFAAPIDLDRLDGDVHRLGAIDDRHHDRAREHDRWFTAPEAADDQRAPLIHEAVEARQKRDGAQHEDGDAACDQEPENRV